MLKLIITIFVLSSLCVGCGSGRSDITEINNYTPEMTVSLLKKEYLSDDTILEAQIASKINSAKKYNFEDLWSLMAVEDEFLNSLSSEKRLKLFSFQKQFNKCDTDTFSAFSEVAIKYNEGINVLKDENLRPCQIGLSEPIVKEGLDSLLLKYQNSKSSVDAKNFIDYFLMESSYGKNKDWENYMSKISNDDWSNLGDDLLKYYHGDKLQQLIKSHISVSGEVPFAKPLAVKLAQEETGVTDLTTQVGLASATDFLTFATDADLAALNKQKTNDLLANLLTVYKTQEKSSNGLHENLQLLWQQMIKLRKLQSRLTNIKQLDNRSQIKWLNELHDSFEETLLLNEKDAVTFLNKQSVTVPELYWFRLKVWQKFEQANKESNTLITLQADYDRYKNSKSDSLSFIEELLHARLDLRLSTNGDDFKKLKENYCQIVGHKEISLDKISYSYKILEEPGCLTARKTEIVLNAANDQTLKLKDDGLTVPDGIEAQAINGAVSLSVDKLKMSSDAALFLPAINLSITSTDENLNLSYINLSADQVYENKIVDSTPSDHDGIILPVPLVIHNKVSSDSLDEAIVVPLAFVYQQPFTGQIWADQLMTDKFLFDGVNSGSLQLNVMKNTKVIYPHLVAKGGLGQVWDSQDVAGGVAKTFDFFPEDYLGFDGWFSDFYADAGSFHKNLIGTVSREMPYSLDFHIDSKNIVSIVEKSEDQEVYFPKNFLDHLPDENIAQQYLKACLIYNRENNIIPIYSNGETDISKACLKNIASKAWDEINKVYDEGAKNNDIADNSPTGIGGITIVNTTQDIPMGVLENDSISGADGVVQVTLFDSEDIEVEAVMEEEFK